MPSIPAGCAKRLAREYPNLSIRWNDWIRRFQVIERFHVGAVARERVIWDYENADETPLPFSQDHCLEFLHSIDTRKWPLKDRVRLWRQERKKHEEGNHQQMLGRMNDFVSDNEIYFSSSERFFMDPTSMPEWKTKYMPSQARALKRLKAV